MDPYFLGISNYFDELAPYQMPPTEYVVIENDQDHDRW